MLRKDSSAVFDWWRRLATGRDSKHRPKPCGVDFLVNGYVVLPPTPGYREDPEHPLESAAVLPQEVIDLAIEKQKQDKERPTGDIQGQVTQGKRNITACSLAGTMRKRGMSIEAVRMALKADNEVRFNPPLGDEEIEDIMKSVAKWEQGEPEHSPATTTEQEKKLTPWIKAQDAPSFCAEEDKEIAGIAKDRHTQGRLPA